MREEHPSSGGLSPLPKGRAVETGRSWQEAFGPVLRAAQIIVGAMTAGALAFLAIAVYVRWGRAPAAGPPVLTWVAIGAGAAMLAARMILPPMIVAQRRAALARGRLELPLRYGSPVFDEFLEKSGDAGVLWVVYQANLLIAAAPLEGAAFFALVAYLVEGSPWALGAAAVLIATLARMIPTRETVFAWMDDQLRLLDQERRGLR